MVDYDITEKLEARIASECPGFVSVAEAWFSAPIDDFNAETPAAYVYLAEDEGNLISELNHRQGVAAVYGVFIICEAGATLRALRRELRPALFGWQPIEEGGVMAYHSGQMQEIRGRYVWWREYWTLSTPDALTASRPRTMTI